MTGWAKKTTETFKPEKDNYRYARFDAAMHILAACDPAAFKEGLARMTHDRLRKETAERYANVGKP